MFISINPLERLRAIDRCEMSTFVYLFTWMRAFTGWTDWHVLGRDNDKFVRNRISDNQIGILDYIFIVPMLLRWLMFNNEEADGLIVTFKLLYAPFKFINEIAAFIVTLLLSPFIIAYKKFTDAQTSKMIQDIHTMEFYAMPDEGPLVNAFKENIAPAKSWLLEKCKAGEIQKSLLNQKRPDHIKNLQFKLGFYEEENIFYIEVYKSHGIFLGLLIPFQGNKNAVKAIVELNLFFSTCGRKDRLKLMRQLNKKLEPFELKQQKTQFEALFCIRQAAVGATTHASKGAQEQANSKVPVELFNDEISKFLGLPAVDEEATKHHNSLHKAFLGRNFVETFDSKSSTSVDCKN